MSSIIETTGITGLPVYQITGFERMVYDSLRVEFDPSKIYQVKASIKVTSSPTGGLGNLARVGVEGIAADGSTLVGTDGSLSVSDQYYVAANDHDMDGETPDAWVEFIGYVGGQGAYVAAPTTAAAPSPMHADVAYIRPVVWVNMPDGNGTVVIDGVSLANLYSAGECLNANVQWADISQTGSFTGSQALSALSVDISSIPNGGCAGRVGTFTLNEPLAHDIGNFCTINPLDGYMYFATLYDGACSWFPGLNLAPNDGEQSFALPGAIVRNDAWSWIAGKDIYLGAGSGGGLTQEDPAYGVPRFKVGQAITSKIMHFDPQDNFACDLNGFVALPQYNCGSLTPKGIIYWNSGLLLGCTGGKILRSSDYGLTFTTKLDLGSDYTFNAFCEFDGYLYACADHSPGFAIYRSNNGIDWTLAYLATANPYAADLVAFGSLLLVGISTGSIAKIWSSPDGTTWTSRYVSPSESVFCQFALRSGSVWALVGGANAKAIRSPDGTTWTVISTITGYPEACALITYSISGTQFSLCAVNDGAVNNRVYLLSASSETLELSTVGNKPNGLFAYNETLYLCGGDTSGGGLYRRVMVNDTTFLEWDEFLHSVTVGECRRFALADNGYVYCLRPSNSIVYKIPRAHQLIT